MSMFCSTIKSGWLAVVLLMLLTAGCKNRQHEASSPLVDTIPMMVMQIQKCSRLYAAECKMHKIVTHNDTLSIRGQLLKRPYRIALPLGERKVAIPMDAVVKGYIDFSTFSADHIERHGSKIHIILPDPKVQLASTTINHDDVKQYVALMRRRFSDEELAAYERQGRQAIVADIPMADIVEQARENAARILIPMCVRMGFAEADITVSFRNNLNITDIGLLPEHTQAGK